MIKTNKIDIETLDFFILNDQPMTCGNCGSRTTFDVEKDETQIHQCLNLDCGYKFIAVEDID